MVNTKPPNNFPIEIGGKYRKNSVDRRKSRKEDKHGRKWLHRHYHNTAIIAQR